MYPRKPLFPAGIILPLLCAHCSATSPARGLDWDQWHGPSRNLVSGETEWDAEWADGEPKVLWRAEVGIGFSTISVSSGKAYTLGHRSGKETVYCFDVESGAVTWKHAYPAQLVDNLHEGGPSATPTVDGENVYTLSRDGRLFCFRKKSGDIVWQREIRKLLGVKLPEWGFSSSPLVRGEHLILDAGPLAALDRKTGDLLWKTRPYRAGYGSPVAFEVGGNEYLSVLNNDGLLLATPAGKVLDLYRWSTSYETSSTTPIVRADTLFISTGYDAGCALVRIDGGKLREVYRNKNVRNHMNNCVLYEGHLYGFDGQSNHRSRVNLVCMDHATGKVRWKQGGLGCGSLMVAGGKLVILGDRGELVIAAASPDSFREISRKKVLDGKCWTMPVLSGGRIYCRNAPGDLVCLDVRRSR